MFVIKKILIIISNKVFVLHVWPSTLRGGVDLCLLFGLDNDFTILHHLPGGIFYLSAL